MIQDSDVHGWHKPACLQIQILCVQHGHHNYDCTSRPKICLLAGPKLCFSTNNLSKEDTHWM